MRECNPDEWNLLGISSTVIKRDELMALEIKIEGTGQSYLPSCLMCTQKCRFTFQVCVEFPSVYNCEAEFPNTR